MEQTISLSTFARTYPALFDSLANTARGFILTRRGKPVARLMAAAMTTYVLSALPLDSHLQRAVSSHQNIPVSDFVHHVVKFLDLATRTGQGFLLTRRGAPVARVIPYPALPNRAEWLGALQGTGMILGDIVAPACTEEEWKTAGEALERSSC